MQQFDSDQQSAIREARALIKAAFCCPGTKMRRYTLLLRWAKELLQPLADEGVTEAQWLLFSLPYKVDKRLSEDEFEQKRMEQVRALAKADSVDAQFFLACELDDGEAVEEASELFKTAAQQGHTHAKWCHGLNLLSGHGIEKNEPLGLQYIEEAAHEKFEWAIQFLSRAYASGTYGYPKDEERAAAWWAKLTGSGVTWVMRD